MGLGRSRGQAQGQGQPALALEGAPYPSLKTEGQRILKAPSRPLSSLHRAEEGSSLLPAVREASWRWWHSSEAL